MKTKTILFLLTGAILGCSSPEQKLIKEVETYFISTLNDPKSYERELFIIKDSMTVLEYNQRVANLEVSNLKFNLEMAESSVKNNQSMFELVNDNYYRLLVKKGRIEVDSLRLLYTQSIKKEEDLKQVQEDGTIKFIYFKASFRAKNSFGALVKGENEIQYDVISKEYQIYE